MNEFHQSETKETDFGKVENTQKIKPKVELSMKELFDWARAEFNQPAGEARNKGMGEARESSLDGDTESGRIDANAEPTEMNGKRELSEDEINEKQTNQILEALKRIDAGEELSDAEKGNLGEMLMDQYYIKQGYSPIHENRVTSLDDKTKKGIDGVYEKTMPDGTKRYVIGEAKVNHSDLSTLKDGTKQMSDKWVDDRLDDAVGKEKADEIRDAYEDNPESVSKEMYHFSYVDTPDGTSKSETIKVHSDGEKGERKVVQEFDRDGHEINGGMNDD